MVLSMVCQFILYWVVLREELKFVFGQYLVIFGGLRLSFDNFRTRIVSCETGVNMIERSFWLSIYRKYFWNALIFAALCDWLKIATKCPNQSGETRKSKNNYDWRYTRFHAFSADCKLLDCLNVLSVLRLWHFNARCYEHTYLANLARPSLILRRLQMT